MWLRFVLIIIGIISLSIGLAWISTEFQSIDGWASFLVIILIGLGILIGGWLAISRDPAILSDLNSNLQSDMIHLDGEKDKGSGVLQWLGWLLIGAAALRLVIGVLWYVTLPIIGYGSEVEISGYVMADAYNRDKAAWNLAQTEKSLWNAFEQYHHADQYGGMLFGSAFVYRYIGGETHQPLQIVVLTASISTLAILFTWVFAYRVWNGSIAGISAWIVALFPDAVLLGSSQMREALLMSFFVMAFYGLMRLWQDRSLAGFLWMVGSVLIVFPISPLVGVMLTTMLLLFAVFITNNDWLKKWWLWVVLIAMVGLGLIVVSVFGEQILPGGASNPMELLERWMKQAGRWQAYNTEHASGWMQKIFRSTPVWMHTWLILIYGIVRPFLPAALFDSAAAIWKGMVIWRALGWTLLLPFLVIGPFVSWRREGWRSPAMGLSFLIWGGIIISSFRGGGDNWDNPRYRVIMIGLQAALAGWVYVTYRQSGSQWLRRVIVGMGLLLIWWVPWYLRRITDLEWPIQNVFLTIGLGIISVLLYIVIDIWIERRQRNAQGGISIND